MRVEPVAAGAAIWRPSRMLPCHAWLGKTPNSEFESSTEGYAWLNAPMVEAEALDLPLDVVRAARWLGTRARPG